MCCVILAAAAYVSFLLSFDCIRRRYGMNDLYIQGRIKCMQRCPHNDESAKQRISQNVSSPSGDTWSYIIHYPVNISRACTDAAEADLRPQMFGKASVPARLSAPLWGVGCGCRFGCHTALVWSSATLSLSGISFPSFSRVVMLFLH